MFVIFAIVFLLVCFDFCQQKNNHSFLFTFCPKQSGFVGVCKSCKEEAAVGEIFLTCDMCPMSSKMYSLFSLAIQFF